MKNKYRHFMLLFVFGVLLHFKAGAAHIVGGDMYYDYLGNNNYRFYISIYRDCNTITGAQFDNPLLLGIFNSSNQRVMDVSVPFPGSVILPIIFNNPCVVAPTGICTERAIYTTVVNLPPIVGGYQIAHQRCCRQLGIVNIVDAQQRGLTLLSTIPGLETGAWANSSPRFTNYPPLAICNNDELVFDHSATEPDGDSLAYSLITPFTGGTTQNPLPNPINPPNYSLLQWEVGHSLTQQLGPGSTMQIDPITGVLSASPNLTGLYVVGIRVDEYRNGVYLGGNTRDFLFYVVNCVITLKAILPTQEELSTFVGYCNGLTVAFENNSFGGTNYAWDFGVPGITSDVSTQFAPSYTYPSPGVYSARLIVNPGFPCTDTAYMQVILDETFRVSFTATDSVCFTNPSIDFFGTSSVPSFPAQASNFVWNFGANASISSATTANVMGVSFNQAGVFPVTLSGTRGVCEADTTINVTIFAQPIADFELPLNYQCEGQTVSFMNNSTNSFNYFWNFGDPTTLADTSNLPNPIYTYPLPGVYNITLISGSAGECMDTVTFTYEVYEDLIMSFTHQDSLCITGNSFDFIGTVSGPPITNYSWNFGANATPMTAIGTSVLGVTYSQPGTYNVLLTGSFLQCIKSFPSSVFLFREPTIDFDIAPGLQCAPFTAQFIDQSISDTPLDYLWNFSDGTTSTLQNPSHLFNTPGNYPITLQINADEGCPTTLSLTKDQIVEVRPVPVSDFSMSSDQVDICNSQVVFIDQSSGATIISYFLDDGEAYAADVPSNFPYSYLTSGTKFPRQIAINQYGCSNESSGRLYVEPFTVFIPNAFTPDGDQFNNTFQAEVALDPHEWQMEVFNRWGEKIWETFDPSAGWDGFYNDKKAPQGIYTYKVRVVSCGQEDKFEIITGHFSLLR